MDNILKFLIKMQADGGNVVSVARQTEQQLDAISRKASIAGRGLRNAFSFQGFKGALMSIPGMQFLMNPYTMIGAGIGAVVKLGAEAESTNVAFKTLVGSEQKAAEMLDQITDFAAHSPFGKMDLTKNAQMMLNFGVETNKVLPLLKQLGDISGGDKNKMSALSLVMGQVSSTGYLMGQDLLQFINAGFNPIQELSKMTGISVDKLKQKMSDGQITFHNVEQAILHATAAGGKFHGMMEAQSQTLSGKWSTLLDTFQAGAIELSQSINSPIGEVVDLITKAVPKIFDKIKALFKLIADGIKFVIKYKEEFLALAAVIGTVMAVCKAYSIALAAYHAIMTVVTVATKIWTGVQWLLNIALTANPIGIIIVAIAALIAIIVVCWNKYAGFRAVILTASSTMIVFANIIKNYVIARIRELLTGIGLVGSALHKLFAGDFTGAAKDFAGGMKQLSGIGSTKGLVMQSIDAVRGVPDAFSKTLAAERAKDNKKNATKKGGSTSSDESPGTAAAEKVVFGDPKKKKDKKKKKKKKKKGRKSAEDIATGGTRNTSIQMRIGKFFDTLHVHMNDKTDTAELERLVVQCMNRALAIATSTDRG